MYLLLNSEQNSDLKAVVFDMCDIAQALPKAPVASFFLCECWYSCSKVMETFLSKGFYTIGALKTNRVIFPAGIRQQISQFAAYIRKTNPNVSLVTVGRRQYYVYRYEGNLTDFECAVALISYPREAFCLPGALRTFICTDASLSTQKILVHYLVRWSIWVFFRQAKQSLALDQYQIRSSTGIRRFWLLMSTAHLISYIGTGQYLPFQTGFAALQKLIAVERISFIYHCGASHVPLVNMLAFAA